MCSSGAFSDSCRTHMTVGPWQHAPHKGAAPQCQDESVRRAPISENFERRRGGCSLISRGSRPGRLQGHALGLFAAVFLLTATSDGLGVSRDIIPHARMDPEYACVYDRNTRPPGLLDQISAAHRYKQYLTAQNRILRRKIARVCASVPDAESGSLSSISQSREMQPDDCGQLLADLATVADSSWTVPPMDGLSDDEGTWRSDVNERYKELVPPKKRPPSLHSGLSDVCLRKAAEQALSSSSSASLSPQPMEFAKPLQPPSAEGKVEEAVMLLDLDKCSFFGNDANDLGIALQWMDKGYEDVRQLYRILFNPNVRKTYDDLRERARRVRVVIYTMRATFLVYRSCFRDAVIPLRWKPTWHHGSQVHFPASAADADAILATYSADVALIEEERTDLRKSLERLLATRDIVATELGLPELPDLVVTATPKTVEGTVSALGYPLENAFLWDDNHRLRDNPRVVSVPPFESLPPAPRQQLLDFLAARLPASCLEADLVDFMMGADPRDRVLGHDRAGALTYRIPACAALPEWPLPDLLPPGSTSLPSPFGREVKAGVLLQGTGHMSPVTPECGFPPGMPPAAMAGVGGGGSGSLQHSSHGSALQMMRESSHEKLREAAVGAP